MTLRDIGVVFGIDVDQKSVNTVENTIKSVKNVATKLLGAVAIGFSFSALNSVAEEFNGINDKIRNATREMGDQEEIQQKILQAANDTRMAYSDMADFVTQLVQEDKNIFGDLDTATEFATLATKTLKAAGRADSEITSAQTLLNKVFAEGSMSSATYTKVLKSYPELINTMAEGLGVTTDQLSAMADAGQITSQTLVDAFSGAADTIDANFEELDYSISDAITNIKNSWGLFVDDIWTGSGLANDAGKMMVRAFNGFLDILKKIQPYVERLIRFLLSGIQRAMDLISRVSAFIGQLVDRIGGVENALKLIAIVAGAIWVALNASKILDFLKTAKNTLAAANLQILGTIAVIVALALIVEDFINFMQGNDSVIGSLFDKAGIGADNAREAILEAWTKAREFLLNAWDFIKQAAGMFTDTVNAFFEKHGESIRSNFERVWGIIKTFLNGVWTFISQLASALFGDTEDSIDGSTTSTRDRLLSVWQAILDALTAVWDALYAAGSAVFNLLASIIETVFGWIQAFWKAWGSTILSWFKTLWDSIGGILNGFLDIITGVANFISSVFTGDWQGAWQAVQQIFSGVWNVIASVATAVWETIKMLFQMGLAAVQAVWETVWNAVSSFFMNIWNGIVSFLTGIVAGIASTVGNIKDTIVDGIQSAIDWITSLPSQAVQWGADIISGIAEGITGAISQVTDAVSGVAEKITSFLHFSVPDEGPLADFQSWMPDMMSGLAEGIEDNESTVMDKVNDLASGISTLVQSATASAATASSGAASNSSTTNVTQNNTFNNSYSGSDREAQKNVSKGMNQSAQDATTYLAKGLAYAR